MNKVHSINNPVIVNGKDMKASEFGIVRKCSTDTTQIKKNQSVFKAMGRLICLENGLISDYLERYEVEIKDTLTLQRIK